jgi:hypothetical protein
MAQQVPEIAELPPQVTHAGQVAPTV